MFSEVRQVQDHCVDQVGEFLFLCSQIIPNVCEMTVFKVCAFDQLGQYICYIAAGDLRESFLNQKLRDSFFLLMENDRIELEPINSLINRIIQLLKLLFGKGKIISDHFLQVRLSWLISVHVFVDDMTYVLDRMHIVNSFVLLMMLNASFGLADCACTCTS